MDIKLRGIKKVKGKIFLPGDKSISHRALLLGGIAKGRSKIKNISYGLDVVTTERIQKLIGIKIERNDEILLIDGVGLSGFERLLNQRTLNIYCENSGTTARLMMGLLAGAGGSAIFTGDESLSKRPMDRVVEPLKMMGAKISSTDGKLPVRLQTSKLSGIEYEIPVPSAQVKSALILASLFLKGSSRFVEKIITRDHTERMLEYMNADIRQTLYNCGKIIEISGRKEFDPLNIEIPGDISSAIFFIVASLIIPGSELIAEKLLLNPTRSHVFEILKRMGANIYIEELGSSPEPYGNVRSKFSFLRGVEILPDEVPLIIDEIPAIAVAGFFAKGKTSVRGAGELRVKESDRIKSIINMLRAFGGRIEEFEDGFEIYGPNIPKGCMVNTYHDHRIAMAASIMAIATDGEVLIKDADSASVSYPGFYNSLEKLTS